MNAWRLSAAKLALLATGCGVLLTACPGNLVFIRDEGLETAIRQEIGKPFDLFLTETDMLEVENISARNLPVKQLDGIETAINLQTLDVSNNTKSQDALANLTPIGQLVSNSQNALPLTFLNLTNNNVSDVNPLKGLRSLRELRLGGNFVSNIEPLVTLSLFGTLETVVLSRGPLLDESGAIRLQTQEDIRTMEAQGVVVELVSDT